MTRIICWTHSEEHTVQEVTDDLPENATLLASWVDDYDGGDCPVCGNIVQEATSR